MSDSKLGALTPTDVDAYRLRKHFYNAARHLILGRKRLPSASTAGMGDDDEDEDGDKPSAGTSQQDRHYDGAVKHGAALDLD